MTQTHENMGVGPLLATSNGWKCDDGECSSTMENHPKWNSELCSQMSPEASEPVRIPSCQLLVLRPCKVQGLRVLEGVNRGAWVA